MCNGATLKNQNLWNSKNVAELRCKPVDFSRWKEHCTAKFHGTCHDRAETSEPSCYMSWCHVQPIPAGSTVPFGGLNLNRWFCLYRASTLDVQPQLKSPLFPALQEELVGGGNPFFSSFSPWKWSGIGLSNVFYPLKTQGSAAQRLERQRSKDTGCPTLQIDG